MRSKKILDKAAVHTLRLSGMSDVNIARHFEVLQGDVGKQCGNRKDNNIPNSRDANRNPYSAKRNINTEAWASQEKSDEYWKNEGDIIYSGGGPIPILHSLKRGW